jgi:uncharacterized membrane protein YcaP (DUF421 family)
MDKDEIKLSDWQRILLGNAPVEFLLEVFVRTLFTYFILLVVIRLLGKRMSGQLTSTEMAIMLVLGAIVSVPMQTPERGILQGVFMLFLFLGLHQFLTGWMRKNEKVEGLVQGTTSILVKDGVMQLPEMDSTNISREQLFAVLRGQQIYNLGKVKRLYFEACGEFSTYKEKAQRPGLSILPRINDGIENRQQRAGDEQLVCKQCGHVVPAQTTQAPCSICGEQQWEQPVL